MSDQVSFATDGLLQDLGMRATSEAELAACHATACAALAAEQPVTADDAAPPLNLDVQVP